MTPLPLCFPSEVLRQHLVVLGMTGAGKSATLRHIVEHLLAEGKRVCVIDPKGDWHGIKVGADGKTPGFPVVAFGNFKDTQATDIPIHAQAGKAVAELVATGHRPALVGFRGWMPAQLTRFWIDFASTLFNLNAGELYLVIDEVHNLAAKGKILDPLAGQCLHWTNRLMSEGRGNGITALIASQRPQKVHNDTLTCCGTLVTMRAVHKSDRSATADWIEGCGDGTSGKEILNTLAALRRGEAWVWSPVANFGPKLVIFPKYVTFDSFAPPQAQPAVLQSGWAQVDLAQVREKMAAVEAEVKANDPKALHAEVRRLRAELAEAQRTVPVSVQAEATIVERPVFTEQEMTALNQTVAHLGTLISSVTGTIEGLRSQVETTVKGAQTEVRELMWKALHLVPGNQHGQLQRIPKAALPSVKFTPPSPQVLNEAHAPKFMGKGVSGVKLGAVERAFLAVLAYRTGSLRLSTLRDQLAVKAGYSANSGHVDNTLGSLRAAGYIEGDRTALRITERGAAALGSYQTPPQGQDLINQWLGKLGAAEKKMLEVLVAEWNGSGDTLTRDQVAERAGYAIASGHVDNTLGSLRSLCLIIGPRKAISASPFLMKD